MAKVRYVGLDVHKRQVTVTAVNAQQTILFPPQKFPVEDFTVWAQTHLRLTDHVALAATANAWEFHDQLVGQVASISVANSHQLKFISSSARKTDKHDALVLAKLLAAHLLGISPSSRLFPETASCHLCPTTAAVLRSSLHSLRFHGEWQNPLSRSRLTFLITDDDLQTSDNPIQT